MELLCKEGLAAGPPWKLTELGHQRLKQGVVLRGQKKVLRRHTGDFREASTYQLLLELDAQGWSHQILTPKKHRLLKKAKHKHVLEPFLLGAEEDSNAWYTQEGRTFVSHYYLLALVEMVAKKDTPDHIKEVPFGAADDVYKMLLGMDVEEKNKKHTRIRKRLTHVSDELWPAEKEKGDKKKKRKKAGEAEPVKKKTKVGGSAPVFGSVSPGESGEPDGHSENELDDVSISDSESDESDDEPPGPPVAGACPESSSKSSSSDSDSSSSESESDSSSSSSSSSEADAAGDAEAAPKAAAAKAKPKPGGKKTTDRSFWWGDHLITPVGPVGEPPKNFQIRCGCTSHNVERACTKKRAVTFGGPDVVLHCLKYWASLGVTCATSAEHFKLWDTHVITAWKAGALPPLDGLISSAA